MFGLFGKKPSPDDAAQFLSEAVEEARIEPYYEKGNYAAFMVFLDCSPDDFKKNAIHQQSVGALISAVERRIQSDDFDDPAADIDMVQLSRQSGHWEPNMLAKRIIIAGGNRPVCSWDIEIGADGTNRIAMQGI